MDSNTTNLVQPSGFKNCLDISNLISFSHKCTHSFSRNFSFSQNSNSIESSLFDIYFPTHWFTLQIYNFTVEKKKKERKVLQHKDRETNKINNFNGLHLHKFKAGRRKNHLFKKKLEDLAKSSFHAFPSIRNPDRWKKDAKLSRLIG